MQYFPQGEGIKKDKEILKRVDSFKNIFDIISIIRSLAVPIKLSDKVVSRLAFRIQYCPLCKPNTLQYYVTRT